MALFGALFASTVAAQLSGTVGPLTTSAEKEATKVCNILDYGGVASIDTDNGDAISQAWTACASGGQVYIPSGDYGLATWVTLNSGSGVSINIEGTIYRTGTSGGNMIYVEHSSDVEIYSATGTGAIQGYGYEFHQDGDYGARIMRLYKTTNFSVHDIALVDSPAFHLTLDTCESGEIYNTIIHGGYEGGLDGIDIWGSNIWVHDVEVSNKDECVTVKSPADHVLVESVHCNWSGGCAMGSLGADTDIHDIEYRNIYTHNSNQMYMFKSNGGSGSVYNVALTNFTGHSNAYTFDLDSAWSSQSVADGDGVLYHDITVEDWAGTCADGTKRAPLRVLCPTGAPCYDLEVAGFDIGTDSGSSELQVCANAYGSGGCLVSSASGTALSATYASTTITVMATSTGFTSMSNELSTGFAISSSIPVPTLPASFYPGLAPKSAILSGSAANATAASTSAAASSAAKSSASSSTKASASSSAKSASTSSAVSTTAATAAVAASKSSSASTASSSVSTKATSSAAAASAASTASSKATTKAVTSVAVAAVTASSATQPATTSAASAASIDDSADDVCSVYTKTYTVVI